MFVGINQWTNRVAAGMMSRISLPMRKLLQQGFRNRYSNSRVSALSRSIFSTSSSNASTCTGLLNR